MINFGNFFIFFTLVHCLFCQILDRRGTIYKDLELSLEVNYGERAINNLRPCAIENQLNSLGTESYFYDRCIIYETNYSKCSEAWNLFQGVWNSTSSYNASNPPNYLNFIYFFNWKKRMEDQNLSPIFYSGAGQCPDIVHRLTNVTGIRLISLEDQNGPYSVANAVWCSAEEFNPSYGSCNNNTIWGDIPNGNLQGFNNYEGASFWGPASENFANSSFGTVWAMVRSYQKGTTNVPAFGEGIFRDVELVDIKKQSDVTGYNVIVISNANQPNETCGSGSLVDMFISLNEVWNDTKCIVDPPCVLQFICANDPAFISVQILNQSVKCEYFNAVPNGTNCLCSTDSIEKNSEGQFTSTDIDCPIPKIISSSMFLTSSTILSIFLLLLSF